MTMNNAKGGSPARPDGKYINTAHGSKRGVKPVPFQPLVFTQARPLSSSARKLLANFFYGALVATMLFIMIVMTMIGIAKQPHNELAHPYNGLAQKEISWK